MSSGAAPPSRSMGAQTSAAIARVARERRAQPNGWWGMVLFLCAEATLFGTLIASYFYLDFDAAKWPPAGIKPPSVALPLIATGVLISTSVPMLLLHHFTIAAGFLVVAGLALLRWHAPEVEG